MYCTDEQNLLKSDLKNPAKMGNRKIEYFRRRGWSSTSMITLIDEVLVNKICHFYIDFHQGMRHKSYNVRNKCLYCRKCVILLFTSRCVSVLEWEYNTHEYCIMLY